MASKIYQKPLFLIILRFINANAFLKYIEYSFRQNSNIEKGLAIGEKQYKTAI